MITVEKKFGKSMRLKAEKKHIRLITMIISRYHKVLLVLVIVICLHSPYMPNAHTSVASTH